MITDNQTVNGSASPPDSTKSGRQSTLSQATTLAVSDETNECEAGKLESLPSKEQPSTASAAGAGSTVDHTVSEPRREFWDYSVPVPGSRQNKRIYPRAPVELKPWTQEQCYARFVFVKNELASLVDRYLDLQGLERRPVYSSRMVGTSPSTAVPSIVITCRYDDSKALQDLFHSRAEERLHIGKESVLAQLRSSMSSKSGDKGRPYQGFGWSTTGHKLVPFYEKPPKSLSPRILTMAVGAGVWFASMIPGLLWGPSIDVNGTTTTLTVDHIFSSDRPIAGLPLAKDSEISNSAGSSTSAMNNDDRSSIGSLWEDDDQYDDFDPDDSLISNPPEHRVSQDASSTPSEPLKEKIEGITPETWQLVVSPVNPRELSRHLDWALTRRNDESAGTTTLPNSVSPDGPGEQQIILSKVRHQPPDHLGSVYGCVRSSRRSLR